MPALRCCLCCGERPSHRRGLCVGCYARLGKAVRDGETTWAALEDTGQALPAQKPGDAWRKGFRLRPPPYPPPANRTPKEEP
jgi:hypothetical protein